MHSIAEILFVPMILFLVIVCPLWMILHYWAEARRERNGIVTSASPEDQDLMNRMVALLERMEGRIGALEKILDADHPRWRERERERL
jgi:phage shock protein B